jgi:hypothetical protein
MPALRRANWAHPPASDDAHHVLADLEGFQNATGDGVDGPGEIKADRP